MRLAPATRATTAAVKKCIEHVIDMILKGPLVLRCVYCEVFRARYHALRNKNGHINQ